MRFLKICIFCIVFLALGITLVNVADLQKANTNLSNQLTQQEQTYSGRIDELTVYQEKLVERISLLEENYQKLQTAYDELKAAYDQYIQDSTIERETIQNTVVDLRETIAVLENNADVDAETITALRAEVTTLETSLENQTTTANELQATVIQQEATIAELNTTIETLTEELNSDLSVGRYKGLFDGSVTELKAEDLEGITCIRSYAFHNSKLTSVELPSTVIEIGAQCFGNSSSLTYVNLNKVKTIGGNAFSKCSALTVVEHSGDIITVGAGSFVDTGLESFDFENTKIQSIQPNAFNGSNLTGEILLPSTLTYLGNSAFENTKIQWLDLSLTSLTRVPNSLCKQCDILSRVLFPETILQIGQRAFFGCDDFKSVDLPNKLEVIEDYAFRSSGLSSVTIPASVVDICQYALAPIGGNTLVIKFEESSTWILTDSSSTVVNIEAGVNYGSYFVYSGAWAKYQLEKEGT